MAVRRAVLNPFLAGLVALGLMIPAGAAAAGLDDRDSEPIVLTGADTPLLVGARPGSIVAFNYADGWRQVPVQVDERKLIDYRPVRQFQGNTREFKAMAYADPDTWAEADGVPQTMTANPKGSGAEIPGTAGDPMLDENDEVAMMASDAAGSAAGEPAPAGVDPDTRTPVRVTDPLDPGESRFLYLFVTTTGLDPAAGADLVRYEQKFDPVLPGPYRTAYNFGSLGDNADGPPINPEDSVVETGRYSVGIPSRWQIDGLTIAAGDGADILDGDKSTVGTSGCGRNELTFSRGGGGFIANIDGPVRAIRSFIGANSGTFTQREYVFYEGLFENRTTLRVHPGINQFVTAMDMSEDAIGMTYRNQRNPAGVTIDGVQDSVVPGRFDWEQFSGPQGTVTNVARLSTDLTDVDISSYYQDVATPAPNSSMLCSGDDHSYGAAGPLMTTPLNNSDPTIADSYPELPVSHFSSVRRTWFDGPEAGAALAALRSRQVDEPLGATTGAATDPAPIVDPPRPARLALKAKPRRVVLRPGHPRRVSVIVRNTGQTAARGVRICPVRSRIVRNLRCQTVKSIGPGRFVRRRFGLRLRHGVRAGSRKFLIRATGRGLRATRTGIRVVVRRR
ncbi:MAG: hypothetical protein J0H98_06055 [Solirubrobacterales bacterium]|nr:hypothetical protein [Solirubrobacterales bacterium]